MKLRYIFYLFLIKFTTHYVNYFSTCTHSAPITTEKNGILILSFMLINCFVRFLKAFLE